jgi:hypothetical protein
VIRERVKAITDTVIIRNVQCWAEAVATERQIAAESAHLPALLALKTEFLPAGDRQRGRIR